MGSMEIPSSSVMKPSKITSRSPSPNRPSTTRPWNAATFYVEENTMSRCKSPITMRHGHERGSSADTGLIRMDNVSSHGGSTDDPNMTEDERDRSLSCLRNGSSSELIEDNDVSKTKAMEQIIWKIDRTKDMIRGEQTARDARMYTNPQPTSQTSLVSGSTPLKHSDPTQQQPPQEAEARHLNELPIQQENQHHQPQQNSNHTRTLRTKSMNIQFYRKHNVNEYLKLASNADKHQLHRIKSVFEKNNQKYAQTISQLQKKLDSYNQRLNRLESHGVSGHHRQPRAVLRDMSQGLRNVGGNIRDGITGLSGSVMSKPREIADLIRNKFGSADNINSLSRNGENDSMEEDRAHHGSATLPGGCSLTSSSGGGAKFGPSDEASECSSATSESDTGKRRPRHSPHGKSSSAQSHVAANPPDDTVQSLFSELRMTRDDVDRLKNKLDGVKKMVTKDIETLNHALQEERYRSERLEEQINDLTELHQNEVENLKQTICDMEEKVQYQSEERLRDIHEMLENCQTKISKMEHQQAQHQQYLTLEGLDNSNARALVVKLINIVLTILQVILLLVATAAGILMPFLRTRFRVITTASIVIAVIILMRKLPDARTDYHFLDHIRQFLPVK